MFAPFPVFHDGNLQKLFTRIYKIITNLLGNLKNYFFTKLENASLFSVLRMCTARLLRRGLVAGNCVSPAAFDIGIFLPQNKSDANGS